MSFEGPARFAVLGYGLLLLAGAVTDIRSRRVPNLLVIGLLLLGLAAAAAHLSPAVSVTGAVLGACVGLVLWIPFWFLGMLGAGDVKFFAAGAAWLGPSLAWRAALAAAVIGGVLATLAMLRARGMRSTAAFGVVGMTQPELVVRGAGAALRTEANRSFPYAVPMAIGLAAASLVPRVFL